MRVLVQRVRNAAVTFEGELLGRIGRGLCVFVGFTHGDGPEEVRRMCGKLVRLRIFEDDGGKMNRSVVDTGGGILLVSQFTLYGDATKGNRPSFTEAAAPKEAEALYDGMVRCLRAIAPGPVETGRFGAQMQVELVNDGPVTLLLGK